MTLTDFRTVIRAIVPSAKVSVVDNTFMDLLINKGVDDVNIRAAALREDGKFDVNAEQQTYLFSTVLPNYEAMADGGLWWNEGTVASPNWKKLDPMTRRSLNDQHPLWMSLSSDNPLRYVTENNNLIIDPKPDASLTNGFWAFYIKKATYMTAGGHYPFSGSTIEIANLRILDDAIIDYVRWKLAGPLKSEDKGILLEQDYEKSIAQKIRLLERRLDIGANNARMRGPTIG